MVRWQGVCVSHRETVWDGYVLAFAANPYTPPHSYLAVCLPRRPRFGTRRDTRSITPCLAPNHAVIQIGDVGLDFSRGLATGWKTWRRGTSRVCPNQRTISGKCDFGGGFLRPRGKLFGENVKKCLRSFPEGATICRVFKAPAPLAQLDRASDYGSEGWRFKSSEARHL